MTDHCIEAVGSGNSKGYRYGEVRIGPGVRYSLGAHVAAYMNEHGPVPVGLVVMHNCDNPPCVNPAHLRIGTAADNERDKVAKGRQMWQGRCKRGHDLSVTGVPCNKGRGRRCSVCWKELRHAA